MIPACVRANATPGRPETAAVLTAMLNCLSAGPQLWSRQPRLSILEGLRSTFRVTDAFEEVEEGLRRDKAGELWKRFAPFLIGGMLLIIGGVAANEAWRSVQTRQQQTASKTFSEAMEAVATWQEASGQVGAANMNDTQKAAAAAAAGAARTNAIAKFEAIAKGNDSFALLARQELAELTLTGEPDTAKAAANLDAATRGSGIYADIARLKLAYLKADTASLGELNNLLEPLLKQPGPMKSLSRELIAAKKLATGDAAGARADYLSLSNDYDAPQAMRGRVQRALAVIPKAAGPAAAAASPAAPVAPTPSAQATK